MSEGSCVKRGSIATLGLVFGELEAIGNLNTHSIKPDT